MKNKIVNSCIAIVCLLFLNSCAELMQLTNYTANTWVQTMDNEGLSTPENTLHANAWLSGTGGKVMVIGDLLTSVIGEASGKDMSGAKDIIRSSMNSIASDPNASKNDKANIVGSLFATSGNIANHFEKKNFDKDVAEFYESNSRYTDPESSWYDPYFECRYVIDYEKRQIRKRDFSKDESDNKSMYDCIREQQQSDYESELDAILQENYGMTYQDYSQLPITERPSLMQIVSKSEGTMFKNDIVIQEQEVVQLAEAENNPTAQAIQKQAAEERASAVQSIETAKIDSYVFDSTSLSEAQKSELDAVAEALSKYPDMNVTVIGHSCDIGHKSVNLRKGLKRAEAGKEYLIEKGVNPEQINVDSKGETEPITENTSKENRAQNRRISFVVE